MMTKSQGQRTLGEPNQLQTAETSPPTLSRSTQMVEGGKGRNRLCFKDPRYRWALEVRKRDEDPPGN